MREKELRIALVCFGGVSLAVYMHGISKEILKLIRASAALHAIKDREARARSTFAETAPGRPGEYDTEPVYFELLRDIGRHIDLRVVVDVIAGASAGGINGATLARAISHDLPIQPLRDLWLANADVNVLLAADARAGRWSKLVLKPLVWGAAATGWLPEIKNSEVRQNVSLFLRSRWFKPPLDGPRMSSLMLEAMTSMGAPERPGASLLPSGQTLDLFVTLTDFHGHLHPIPIHDPPLIQEREHRLVLRFGYRRNQSGVEVSDFDLDNAPALAFAARATSSFPGIFPPARISEIDDILQERRQSWPRREQFLRRGFPKHLKAGIDPVAACFIDGAVLNNRPFREAIAALDGRQAYRQVDRRLVYIDPNPGRVRRAAKAVPSMFSVVKGSLSDLPRNQPVADELDWVLSFNDRVRRLRGVIDDARPRVTRLVTEVIASPLDWTVASEQIRKWREQVNARVALEAGFAYHSYVRLKLTTVLGFVTQLIARLCDAEPRSRLHGLIAATLDAWAECQGLTSDGTGDGPATAVPGKVRSGFPSGTASKQEVSADRCFPETVNGAGLPPAAAFLTAFDVEYRKRRLAFLIEGQNRLYQLIEEKQLAGLDPQLVDHLKRDFYACLGTLNRRSAPEAFNDGVGELARSIFSEAAAAPNGRPLAAMGAALAECRAADLSSLLDRLASAIDMGASTHDVDLIIAALDASEWLPDARRDVLVNYLGFSYWDVLTLPIMATGQTGEFHEILVDRISSKDAHTIAAFDALTDVKGVGLGSFAAFLSRSYRENDYLLGRLHAIDRLIDIVCDAAGIGGDDGLCDIAGFKRRAFATVLDAEAPHLGDSRELLATLRSAIHSLGGA